MIRALALATIVVRALLGLAALCACGALMFYALVPAPTTVALAIVAGAFGLIMLGNAGRDFGTIGREVTA